MRRTRAIPYQYIRILSPLFLFTGGIFPRYLNSPLDHEMSVNTMCTLSNGIRPMVRILQPASTHLLHGL